MTNKFFSKFFMPVLAVMMIFATSLSFQACSDDDDDNNNPSSPYVCASCTDTPDALAVNDASVKGIYKGIIVGSTGTISINIQNGSNDITATMVLDGQTINLTSSFVIVEGETNVAPFTGTFNGSPISLSFSIQLGGGSPTVVSSDIPGHPNAVFVVAKETSTSLIEAFEGTYSTSDNETGIFNILLSSGIGEFGGIARNDQTGVVDDDVSGLYNASNGQLSNGSTVYGTITGDELEGSFVDSSNTTITINGQRTL